VAEQAEPELDNCAVSVAGVLCGKLTSETWDFPDMIAEVNAAWKEAGTDLIMTGPAICEDHMWMSPEI